MSDIQAIMKFEFLPNEILIECFEYLNVIDIFNSFDFLNSRFYNLIRYIPLHFNVENIRDSTLVQFCVKMLLNTQIKKQIMSLKLLNKNIFNTVRILLSFVSLDEFSQLQSLTLIDLDARTASRVSTMLPLLTNLRYFHLTESSFKINEIFITLPKSTIQTLSIPRLDLDLTFTHPFTSLVNLTISRCSVENLCYFFKYSPMLQYLSIKRICRYSWLTRKEPRLLTNDHAVYLKRLVIDNFEEEFDSLEVLFKRTPNLKFLMISVDDNIDIVNGCRWQDLIKTSLPFLDVFKFKFGIEFEDEDIDVFDKFQQFQSKFWRQQHHWYTECTFNRSTALIYTVPYMSNEYEITPYTKRYYNESINITNSFANVTNLALCPESITDTGEYHFPNVKLLRLENGRAAENDIYSFFKTKHIRYLKGIVNLCNLTQLNILSECRLKSPSTMLQLLKEAPHVSSLKIHQNTLFPLFNSRELCECFNKMIKKLHVTSLTNFLVLDFDKVVKLCQIFSNMEEFRCGIGQPENLQMTLTELSKLPHMKAFSYETRYSKSGNRWLKDHVSELDVYSFTIKCENDFYHDNDDDDDMYYSYFNYDYSFDYDSD